MNDNKETLQVEKDIFVMADDPLPDMTPDDVRAWYMRHHDEGGLACAYAAAENKAFWVADEEYDHPEGSPARAQAHAIAVAWFELWEELGQEILDILRAEGVKIPDRGQIVVLIPFMERHGFSFVQGWWLKDYGI